MQYNPNSLELPDVRGWLNDDEGRLLAKYAEGKRVLEVGSYCGRSTIWMARALILGTGRGRVFDKVIRHPDCLSVSKPDRRKS